MMFNSDTISIKASAQNFAGTAQFVLKIDGVQVGAANSISANHASGESQTFSFGVNLTGASQISVVFVNDYYVQYGANASFDRNMYIDNLTINGLNYAASNFIQTSAAQSFVVGSSVVLQSNGPVYLNINGYSGHDTIDKTAFGSLEHSPNSVGGQVYALYDTLLGRVPDALGLEGWTSALSNGASLRGVAQTIIGSPEGQSRLDGRDNGTFVEQLYQTTLHRHSDPAGLAAWTSQLDAGANRADVALSFALSPEHITNLSSAYDTGFFVPDATSASVARLYYAVLDRAPDAAGLAGWTAQVNKGTSLPSVTQAFLTSPEAVAKLGALTDGQYIDTIYMNALGRHAEPNGLASWVNQLAHGVSRASVASSIGQSVEAQVHHLADIQAGWHLL